MINALNALKGMMYELQIEGMTYELEIEKISIPL